MQSIVIDILNEKAVSLLRNLESLKLIKLRSEEENTTSEVNWTEYKGAITKQPLPEVDEQLSNLRKAWE